METLKRQKDFETIFKLGKKVYDKKFRLIYLETDKMQTSKVAFVVSKKFGIAVKRNRIKRLLREAWRTIQAPGKGYIFVLLPQNDTGMYKSYEIAEAMKERLEREKILIDT